MSNPNFISAQGYEDLAWEELDRGNKTKAIELLRYGADHVSLGRGRADRMRSYAEDIENGIILQSKDRHK